MTCHHHVGVGCGFVVAVASGRGGTVISRFFKVCEYVSYALFPVLICALSSRSILMQRHARILRMISSFPLNCIVSHISFIRSSKENWTIPSAHKNAATELAVFSEMTPISNSGVQFWACVRSCVSGRLIKSFNSLTIAKNWLNQVDLIY